MKITVAGLLLSILTYSASAFSPRSAFAARSTAITTTRLSMVDSSSAVKEALAASKKFGATSEEARAAWDIVEEMDASNRYELRRIQPASPNLDILRSFLTHSYLLSLLFTWRDRHHKSDDIHQPQAEKKPTGPVLVTDDCEDFHNMNQRIFEAKKSLDALQEAKQATKEHGIHSPEAVAAWEYVEEIAAAAHHHRTTGTV